MIRQGTIDEMLSLWYKKYTSEFFSESIKKGDAEFWTMEENGQLIGELYIFYNLEDKDFTDGKTTAYLCAFRIIEDMQCKGIGTKLMDHVLKRLRALKFSYVTIGVELEETSNIKLYNRIGFTEEVKTLSIDPCDVDCDFKPLKCIEYVILKKKL